MSNPACPKIIVENQSTETVSAAAQMEATTAEVSHMASVMFSVDLLGQILCSYEASQATIETLLWMKCVSKLWPIVVKRMLSNGAWMAPLGRSGMTFVNGNHMIAEDHTADVDDVYLRDFLDKIQQHTWYEPAQHYGLVVLCQQIPKSNMEYASNVHYEHLLNISNNAMITHPKSLRVQAAVASLLRALFLRDFGTIFTFEYSRAAHGLTKALVNFGSVIGGIVFVENVVSNIHYLLEQHKCFAPIFREAGAIETVIKCMQDFDYSYDVVCKCVLVIFEFPVKHIPFILSCGIERVIFTGMQKYPNDLRRQSDSITSLALFYRHGPHSLDSCQDLSPLDLLFDATNKFMHDDTFFRAAVYVFSILTVDVNLFEIHNRFVQAGLIKVIASGMSCILLSTPIIPRDEDLYTNCTQIFFNIAMFEPLRIRLACPGIEVLLETGLVVFPLNVQVFLKTCHLFRVVFFTASEDRRPSPSVRLVKIVLDAMSDNYDEHLLHVECMLTLNVLTNSRQLLNFVAQQDGFKKIIRSLDNIMGIDSTSTAKIKMALQFPHTLQSDFVMACLSLLSKLPLCKNLTVRSSTRLARVVMQIMRQHETQIGVQSLALCVLNKHMLPYPELYCLFGFGIGMALVHSAMNLPDLSSESRVIAQKIIRVCTT